MNILIIIPARGGSKGIPRKNLRSLNKKPLIYYSITSALNSSYSPDVFVTSDDDEILMIAAKIGAKTYKRPDELAGDSVTLDPVILDAYRKISRMQNKKYDYVMTMQPTSPMLRTSSIDLALKGIIGDPGIETVLSARKEAHLTWGWKDGAFYPKYTERVNRQYLEPYFVETGGFLICKSQVLEKTGKRIGSRVNLHLLSGGEEIDIDTYEDWNLCEYLLKRKTILFVVSGYDEIGLGHVYRSLILANSIVSHRIVFLVDERSALGYEKIKGQNYTVHMQQNRKIIEDIKEISPDIVINDILDTTAEYVRDLKEMGTKVVNFEDLGEGTKYADLVINALYPEKEVYRNHYYGPDYFCARDEFLLTSYKDIGKKVERVLITFGGTDPNNLTLKVLETIHGYCASHGIAIDIILGLGYQDRKCLEPFADVSVFRDVNNISDYMRRADVIFTSAGRTVYEIACIGTPAIVMAQNERELTHFFASSENGFINLGLGSRTEKTEIAAVFESLVEDYEKRKFMNRIMGDKSPRNGKARVLSLIINLLEEEL